jgi:hypothetical protein
MPPTPLASLIKPHDSAFQVAFGLTPGRYAALLCGGTHDIPSPAEARQSMAWQTVFWD